MNSVMQARARDESLDLFKTMLIYGMIATHVIQLLAIAPAAGLVFFAEFINLITFSGFLFAFGLGVGLSAPASGRSWPARLTPVAMLLLGAYISSIAFVVLVDQRSLRPQLLLDLFSLRVLFGWSEFLASFFVLYAVLAVARRYFLTVGSRLVLVILISAVCLALTLVTTAVDLPLLATLIGTRNYASFPLLPYLPWFLFGIYLSQRRRRPNRLEWVVSVLLTAGFAFVVMRFGEPPGRFPPSALWILGAALPLLIYLWVARALASRLNIPNWLLAPGRHVLASLLVSNLIIFSARNWFDRPLYSAGLVVAAAAGLLLVVTIYTNLLEVRRRPAADVATLEVRP